MSANQMKCCETLVESLLIFTKGVGCDKGCANDAIGRLGQLGILKRFFHSSWDNSSSDTLIIMDQLRAEDAEAEAQASVKI
ncbi:hypothetical protein OUZ56_026938 [Daphnia magna]|uniref:Uncharacterized protein n=1 Tax=Daphnia magna TaxID=35525 RepID=A0ABQ9ZN99_9CRUS|nr:hypothetical protein OUZ56_026938 [Daphnia magna]